MMECSLSIPFGLSKKIFMSKSGVQIFCSPKFGVQTAKKKIFIFFFLKLHFFCESKLLSRIGRALQESESPSSIA